MPQVSLMELNESTREIKLLKKVELASIPTRNDKVTLDIGGESHIFKVFDVHYADHAITNVLIARISNVNDYNADIGNDMIQGLST